MANAKFNRHSKRSPAAQRYRVENRMQKNKVANIKKAKEAENLPDAKIERLAVRPRGMARFLRRASKQAAYSAAIVSNLVSE